MRASVPDEPEALPGLRDTVRERVRGSGARTRRRQADQAAAALPADLDPVARVLVDLPLAHLDRTFDYLVPAGLAEDAVPGCRVKVRFAGQEVGGYLLGRGPGSEHPGRLTALRRVVSPEPVLSPEIAGLAADLAARYAGTRSDVLRLAVPPRHAATERAEPRPVPQPARYDETAAWAAWAEHPHAEAYLRHLAQGASPRAVWATPPGTDWPLLLAHAAAAAHCGSGRGVLICVPDAKDVTRLDRALGTVLGEGRHVTLTAQPGPARRYRDFLAISRGAVRVVVGTRAAAFAPVHDLGLVMIWDDGDDLHAEPRSPYPHTRETLVMRAEREGAAMLLAGFARSVEAHQLLHTGWARELSVPRQLLRDRVTVQVAGASDAELARDAYARGSRMPRAVHETLAAGLDRGPVLVQIPRLGYAAALACDRCRTAARCPAVGGACQGPLAIPRAAAPPRCRWCGTDHPRWSCPVCGGHGLRAPVIGDARTAEELGRAFPSTPVRTSSGDTVLAEVPSKPAIVVATPGAEPVADGGYAAVVLLDTWLMLARPDLRTGEEAVRRWAGVIGLVRAGGRAIAVGDPAQPGLQALVRWDPGGFAAREAAERASAHLPPASRLATITGEAGAVDDALTLLEAPAATEILGPVPVGDGEEQRVVVRSPRAEGAELSRALLEMQRIRSARKLDAVRVQVDPISL